MNIKIRQLQETNWPHWKAILLECIKLHPEVFGASYEEACQEMGIELIVLPPARLTYNGGVERGNRTFREEFYARHDLLADSVMAIRAELKKPS